MKRRAPIVIGIAGGSGSGKTIVAQQILQRVGADRIAYLQHDSYYKDLSELPPTQRMDVNFDHPDSLETDLLIQHISSLWNWIPVNVPIYDFSINSRVKETFVVMPRSIIIVEGILVFSEPRLREMFDIKIFVDADSDIRLSRRLNRDMTERGRTMDFVIKQYFSTVRPMHIEMVEPSKRFADVIIPEVTSNRVALDMVVAKLEMLLDDTLPKRANTTPKIEKSINAFLCHANKDKDAIRVLSKKLQEKGIDIWLDEEKLIPGQEWELEIPKAVRGADVVIVCLSKNSVSKEGYIQKEIKFALDIADEKPEGTIFIIPVLLEDCDVPARLRKWQWAKVFFEDNKLDDIGLSKLIQAIETRRR